VAVVSAVAGTRRGGAGPGSSNGDTAVAAASAAAALRAWPALAELDALPLVAIDSVAAFHWQDRAWRTDAAAGALAGRLADALARLGERFHTRVVWTRPLVFFPAHASAAVGALPHAGAALAAELAAGPVVALAALGSPAWPPGTCAGGAVATAAHVPLAAYAELVRTYLHPALARAVTRTLCLTAVAPADGGQGLRVAPLAAARGGGAPLLRWTDAGLARLLSGKEGAGADGVQQPQQAAVRFATARLARCLIAHVQPSGVPPAAESISPTLVPVPAGVSRDGGAGGRHAAGSLALHECLLWAF
jgi:hypothetical protein